MAPTSDSGCVSVVIPARNQAGAIERVVRAVLAQEGVGRVVEVLVIDDGSTDETAAKAREAGATVHSMSSDGNPGAARNRGAAETTGDPIVFLDADCVPRSGWLQALLDAMETGGYAAVGGAVAMPRGMGLAARCSYYGGCYHMHPRRPSGRVPNLTPCNIAVRRAEFARTGGFAEEHPVADGHEELLWQAEMIRRGDEIFFDREAVVEHHDRPGFANLLARNYRWAYSSIESKAMSGAVRLSGIYRFPGILVIAGVPLAIPSVIYIVAVWLRAGVLEPLFVSPIIFVARLAYGWGMTVGGLRWLRRRRGGEAGRRVRT